MPTHNQAAKTPPNRSRAGANIRRHRRSRAVRVLDAAELGKLIRRTVDTRLRPKAAAAKALRIDRDHYRKLLRGKAGGTITESLYYRLRLFVRTPSERRAFERALLTPDAAIRLSVYRDWLALALAPLGSDYLVAEHDDFRRRRCRPPHCTEQWAAEAEVLVWLRKQPDAQALLDRFGQWAAAHGWTGGSADTARYELALHRVLAPLTVAKRTLYVELGAVELHHSQRLRAYLRAALDRERVLMDRAPDLQRVQTW